MQDFEKLGVFYLGRVYDPAARQTTPQLLLYDSKDLVTHAVCIGMTGSGKTGLCLSLLEEALIDGIPALIVDPKGDLANLLLTFPDLRPEDFAPWVNEDDAQRRGLTVAQYAEQQAALWAKGLADWGQSGERIKRLRQAAELAIYTPGSTTGLPVSILGSFAAPAAAARADGDAMRERIATTATSVLSLLGIDADPLRSREHILLAKILETAWAQGRDLDLPGLIQQIQAPPVSTIGVLAVDAFFPAPDRFALAMQLNNLLAAPGFDAWLQGAPLDIDHLLHTAEGTPRAAIFSIAHLNDSERMFFVSLLLNETVAWMRAQSGTTSLRAILYMDEIFGYFPPVANPPSKPPLLTLLKQARAFGLGVVLATQNPVDLDYKGLANTGTWFIGRLQTERDKARVLEGLEGAAAAGHFDRQALERLLSALGNRVFLLNNVHEDAPVVFEARWAMSYLRGPLARNQIKLLMQPPAASAGPAAPPSPTTSGATRIAPIATPAGQRHEPARPVLPPDLPQYFVPVRGTFDSGGLVYTPTVVGAATVRFTDAKAGVDTAREVVVLADIAATEALPVDWAKATPADIAVGDLEAVPHEGATYAELPTIAAKAKSYATWSKDFASWLYGAQQLDLLASSSPKLLSAVGESERDFRIRLQDAARQERDARADALRAKYAPKTAALQERLRRAEQAMERERAQATQQGVQTAISVGATLLGALLGRKRVSAATIGRATTSARGVGRVLKEREDVGRAAETTDAIRQQLADLDAELQAEMATLEARSDPLTPLQRVAVKPKKSNISVRLVALAWVPHTNLPDAPRPAK